MITIRVHPFPKITKAVISLCLLLMISRAGFANVKVLQQNHHNVMLTQNTVHAKNPRDILQKFISVDYQHEALLDVLQNIAQKADLKLVYSDKLIPSHKQITLRDDHIKVEDALWKLLKGTHLRFAVSSHHHLVLMKSKKDRQQIKQTAQTGSITGMVTDAQTGKPLPGANVYFKDDATRGATTGKEGRFTITGVETGKHILIASFVGYKRKEKKVTVRDGQKTAINFAMQPTKQSIGEVVVNGFGKAVSRRRLTSDVTTLKEKDLGSLTEGSIDKMLLGKAPGVSITESSGAVGSVPVINIRGASTLTGSSQPLWVLDGVILQNPVPLTPAEINSPNAVDRIGNEISGINPSDIESINVLKGASATAIYGAKAAHGVIVLKTKSGNKGEQLKVNYRTTVEYTQHPTYRRFNKMNSKQRIGIEEYYFNNSEEYYNADANINSVGLAGAYARYKNRDLKTWGDFKQAVRKAQTYNTDWFDVLFRNPVSTFNNLNFSGGTQKTTYFASLSANTQPGADIKTDNNRYTGLAKVDFYLSNDFDIRLTLSGYKRKRSAYPRSLVPAGGCAGNVVSGCNGGSSNIVNTSLSSFARQTPQPFQYALNTSRTFPIRYTNGDYYMYRGHNDFYLFNILNEYNNSDQTTKSSNLRMQANINWDVLDNLSLRGIFNYTYTGTHQVTYYKANTNQVAGLRRSNFDDPAPANSILPRGGLIFNESDFQNYYLTRVSLRFLPIDTGTNRIKLLSGAQYRQTNYQNDNTTGYGYLHDRGKVISTSKNIADKLSGDPYLIISDYNRKYASFFGIATYSYKDKYIVNGNLRYDGSNKFGINKRWKPSWSVSGRWNMSSESFMDRVDLINQLAFRASYGVEGSTNEQYTPQLVAHFKPPAYYSNLNLLGIQQPANPNLTWEKTYNAEVGIDFRLLDNRIEGSFNLYHKKSVDLVALTKISQVNGFSQLPINFANVLNKGIEVGLATHNIQKKNIAWTTTFNFSYNKNRVTSVNRRPDVQSMLSAYVFKPDAAVEGRPLNSLYSVKFAGVDPSNGIARFRFANGDTTTAASGLDFVAEDLKYSGTLKAPYSGSFNNEVDYNNFEFSFLFTYKFGNVVRMPAILQSQLYAPDQNISKTLLNAWGINGNVDTDVPKILGITGSHTYKERWNQSDLRVASGSYVRLKNVSLKYNLPDKTIQGLGLSGAYIQIEGNNLLLFDSDKLHGFDPETISYQGLPNLRSYAATINISF